MCRMNCTEGFLWAPCKAPDVGGVQELPNGSLKPYVPPQWGWHPCPECNRATERVEYYPELRDI